MPDGNFSGEFELRKYERWLKGRGCSPKTLHSQPRNVERFFEYVIDQRSKKNKTLKNIEGITHLDLRDWRDYLVKDGKRKTSVKAMMAAVRSFYRSKYEERYSQKWFNTLDRMKSIKNPPKTKQDGVSFEPLSIEEIHLMIDTARSYVPGNAATVTREAYPFIMLLAYSALRAGNAYSLRIDEIDFAENEIIIEKTKTGKKTIPMHKDLKKVLLAHLGDRREGFVFSEGRPNGLSDKDMRANVRRAEQIVKIIAKHAGLKGIHPHRFRKGVGAYLNKKGVPLKIIQAILTHANFQMTADIYTKQDMEDVKREFNKHSFTGSVEPSEPQTDSRMDKLLALSPEKLDKLLALAEVL